MKKILLTLTVMLGVAGYVRSADHFVTNPADSGPQTLRDAVANATSGDNIYFDVVDTIKLTSGVITLDKSLTFYGTGFPVISGENNDRIFVLNSGFTLYMEDITFVNGLVTSGNGGGAVYLGGGDVNIHRCNFYDNSCTGALNTWGGGAVSAGSGNIWLEDCHFEGNSASGTAAGGAINNQTPLTLYRCTVNNNSASGGSWKYGGAINAAGNIFIYYSTISGNTISTSGTAYGAGVSKAMPGTMVIKNSTITGNEILSGNDWGAGVFSWGTNITIKNNIIAENKNASSQNSDIYANSGINSGGHNVITNVVNGFNLVSTDIQSSPNLGPLQNNGGNTPTHAISCSSPAHNSGDNTEADSIDQRGTSSIIHGQRDIGAYEYDGSLPTISSYTYTNISCNGSNDGSATVTAASLGSNYTWSNGNTGITASNLSAGDQWLEEVNALGCTVRDSFVVTEPTDINISLTETNTSCVSGSDGSIAATISGGSPGYTYDWDNDGTGDFDDVEDLSGLSSGNYQLIVQDNNGCLKSSPTVTISSPASIGIFNIQTSEITCNGDANGFISFQATGGTPPFTYSLDNINYGASSSFLGLSPGNYTPTVQDDNGCTAGTSSITLSDPPVMSQTSAATDASCFDKADGTITITATGGNGGFAYSTDGTNYGASNAVASLDAGTYTTYAQDANGCIRTDMVTISEPTEIVITGVTSADSGSANGSIDITVSGGASGYTFSWDDLSNSTTEDISSLVADDYTVTVTDASLCEATEIFTVADASVTALSDSEVNTTNVYPNPFSDVIHLTGVKNATLTITDLSGKTVIETISADNSTTIGQRLPSGIYILHIANHKGVSSVRITKL